ncbi:ATP-binding protein [Rhodococcus rhodochrous]|uniref:LuxR family transcriptional regulator n=1 Tax=Rhodococcus rhodochrous KG-21 TaxID=1441923 RepID=A0A0M9WP75_RHORH|nr:LuxR C-terminal-related transcriptional regulator [Rhodococcus rhodochrous]KOS56347.1 LuxR family transcriptional regulator [Rhodococcus rhodochrous KG-21]
MSTQPGGNLPVELTSFVGRRESITQAKNLLAPARLLTLTGTGGVGKSRFALKLGRELRREFPDGAWITELADLNEASLLATTVGRSLGIRDEWSDATGNLLSHLENRRLLLILDNCEHLLTSCAELISRILRAAPDVKIIATSRHVLGVEGEQVFPVPPLGHEATNGLNEAMLLFEERASAADPAFRITDDNRDAVETICRTLEGIPLAVELAAANVRAFNTSDIADRLRSTTFLRATERTRPSRHRSLADAAEWSYQLCTPDERRLWEHLSVFSGGFTVDAAAEVCLLPDQESALDRAAHYDTVLQALIGLIDKSIVSRIEAPGPHSRYRMLEPVRQFGLERLAASPDTQQVRRRHHDYFFRLAQRSITDYCSSRDIDWYATTRAEHANIREALTSSLSDLDRPQAALDMAKMLTPFWQQSGSVLEGYEWIRRALDLVTAPCIERASGLVAASILGFLLGRTDEARAFLREHREVLAFLGSSTTPPITLYASAFETYEDGDIEKALSYAKQAVEQGIDRENPGLVSEAMALSVLYAIIIESEEAEQLAEQFLQFTERHSTHLLKAVALFPLGAVKWYRGELESATSLMREAIRLYQKFTHPGMVAVCIEGLAWSSAESDPERAAMLLGAARSLWQHSQMPLAQDAVHRVTSNIETAVRQDLGDRRFDQKFMAGQELSFDESVALALGTESETKARPRNRASDAGLTRREGEIAALVADGLTNKQIATKLVISPRTVDAHVEHILTKLGFRSRTQIARWLTAS